MVFKKYSLLILFLTSLAAPSFADDLQPKSVEGRKPRTSEAFREDCAVVPVSWVVPETRQKLEGKPTSAGQEFSASDVSVLSITNSLPEHPVPAGTVVSREVLDELVGLLTDSKPNPPKVARPDEAPVAERQVADAGQSYLQELQELGQQDSSWVLLNSQYAESEKKAVQDAQPSYLSELRQLDSRIHVLRPIVQTRKPTPVVVPVRQETVGEQRSLANLFPSVRELSIGRTSDSVPLPTDAGEAINYLHGQSPHYYLTAPKYSVSRPNRMLYPFRNNPLYFEDPNLERCGISHGCLTEVSSAGHFLFNTVILPYRVAAQPPCECVPSLGDCPTCNEFDSSAALPPWSWRGVVAEAGVITGLVFIIP